MRLLTILVMVTRPTFWLKEVWAAHQEAAKEEPRPSQMMPPDRLGVSRLEKRTPSASTGDVAHSLHGGEHDHHEENGTQVKLGYRQQGGHGDPAGLGHFVPVRHGSAWYAPPSAVTPVVEENREERRR